MHRTCRALAVALLLGVAPMLLPAPGFAPFPAPAAAREDGDLLVADATATFQSMMADPAMTWLRANIGEARAVIIAPRIVKAGFMLGGSGGHAVVVMRGRDGRWGGPAFLTLSTGSLGFQAGLSRSEVVTLVMTQRAADSLLSGSFRMGGDLSVAAGPAGGGAKANLRADLISFSRSRGVYGGVNMTGTGVRTASGRNAAYYRAKGVTPIDILITRSVRPQESGRALLSAVAAAAS